MGLEQSLQLELGLKEPIAPCGSGAYMGRQKKPVNSSRGGVLSSSLVRKNGGAE